MLLKTVVIVIIGLIAIYLVASFLIKKIFFNRRLFTNVARKFYNYYYSINHIDHLITNNYGYAPVDKEIEEYDIDLQYGMQLYKEVIKNHNGYVIKNNSSIVEISCGKGGGAGFITKNCLPAQFTGIDFSQKAIDFCSQQYREIKNMNFICADAHKIPLQENSTDVVLNIEASHLYKDQNQFFNEVSRILRSGGKFLFADFRRINGQSINHLEKNISDYGFYIEEKKIVTDHIRAACMQASERRGELVNQVPWYLRKYFRQYAILNGTKKSQMLANGEIVYFIYHFVKK